MSRITIVLVVLLFGSNAVADGNKYGSHKYGDRAEHSRSFGDNFRGDDRRRQTGVCDEVKGATRGLFGLCVAYCQAKDVESLFTKYRFNPRKTKLAALDKQTVLERYNARMKAGDPPMPCVTEPTPAVASCPCWSSKALEPANWQNRGGVAKCLNALSSDELEAGASGSDFAKILSLNVNVETNYCVFVDETSGTEMMELIPESDAATCRAQVKTTCEALNLAG